MKKITLLLVCAVLCATNMMGQTIKVGSQAEGGTWTGPDGLYYATQAVRALQDDNRTEVWRDSIYVSGTLTRPGNFVFNTWGKDRRFIIVGEGMENTTIQSYTDAELAAYEADPGNNPLPAWKPAHATALAFYIAPNTTADVNNKFKVEVQFHDLTINNIWLPDQSQGKGRSAIRVGQHAAAEFHNVKIANCKNPGNDGSAIEGQHSASLVLENCILENNEGKTGTSIFFWTNKESINSSVTISNTVIRDNESLKKAGGVSFWCQKASSNMVVNINNSTFYNNSSVAASSALEINGAGIDISLYNNTFAYNKGGDSGIGCNWDAPEKVTMINTLIYGSTGNEGQSVNDFGIMLDPDTEDPIFTPGDGTTTFTLFTSAIGNTDVVFTGLPTHATSYFNDWLNGWTMGLTETISENNEVIPAAGSVAIDNGTPFPPYTDGYFGANPDIGSYENSPSLSNDSYDKNELAIALYPNPVQNTLNIGFKEELEWQIFSMIGKSILSGTGNHINVEALQSGIYVIKMSEANATTYTSKKFVKQ